MLGAPNSICKLRAGSSHQGQQWALPASIRVRGAKPLLRRLLAIMLFHFYTTSTQLVSCDFVF